MDSITSFSGAYRFLSNFWPAQVKLGNIVCPTVEHAYQAAKTTDLEAREVIARQPTPGRAKALGRSIALRPDWEGMKLQVMRHLLEQKFAQEPLRSRLLATGDAKLVEGNHWGDTFWGVCRGQGQNNLGLLLMNIRSDLERAT